MTIIEISSAAPGLGGRILPVFPAARRSPTTARDESLQPDFVGTTAQRIHHHAPSNQLNDRQAPSSSLEVVDDQSRAPQRLGTRAPTGFDPLLTGRKVDTDRVGSFE